jgi:hypothetical protein
VILVILVMPDFWENQHPVALPKTEGKIHSKAKNRRPQKKRTWENQGKNETEAII